MDMDAMYFLGFINVYDKLGILGSQSYAVLVWSFCRQREIEFRYNFACCSWYPRGFLYI
jgi:hypothetical protein